jgi:hypothetical protein
VSVGPLRGRALAVELLEQLNSLFGLRHCGRALKLRQWPSAYGQMGRCLSPCLNDLDPNLYRRRLDEALALFTGRGDGGTALLAHIDRQMREAAAAQRYERAAWLRRRRERLGVLLGRLGGVLAATHARPRLVLAEHPRGGRFDCFWLVGGRVADWGPLRALEDAAARTAAALRGGDGTGPTASLGPDEVDDARIVATWLESHEALVLDLSRAPGRAELDRFLAAAGARPAAACGAVPRRARPFPLGGRFDGGGGVAAQANGSSTTRAVTEPSPTASVSPTPASRRTIASAIGPCTGETATLPSRPTWRSPSRSGVPDGAGAERRSPRRWRLGFPRQCSRATVSWPT